MRFDKYLGRKIEALTHEIDRLASRYGSLISNPSLSDQSEVGDSNHLPYLPPVIHSGFDDSLMGDSQHIPFLL